MNFIKNLLFLSLQRYLSVEELMIYVGLNAEEIISISRRYGREYPGMKSHLESIFLQKFVLPSEVIRFMTKNADEISLAQLASIFRIEEHYLVNMLYHYAHEHPSSFRGVARSEKFHSELMERFSQIAIERAKQQRRIFTNNRQNTEKLLEISKKKSIEELALIFGCSPQIIEDELVSSGVGGFWHNESIRINYPYFVNNIGNRFSKSELIYIAQNPGEEGLNEKMKTSAESLAEAIYLIDQLKLPANDLAALLSSSKPICKNWIYLNRLLALEKSNKEYLKDFEIEELLSEADEDQLLKYSQNVQEKGRLITKQSYPKYLVLLRDRSFIAELVSSNPIYTKFMKDNIPYLFSNEDIVAYKRIEG